MAETPEGWAVDYAGTKEPEQIDGSFVPAFNDEKSFKSIDNKRLKSIFERKGREQ